MEKIKTSIVITGICGIVVLETVALLKGIDGVLLTVVIGVIGTAIGVAIPADKIFK